MIYISLPPLSLSLSLYLYLSLSLSLSLSLFPSLPSPPSFSPSQVLLDNLRVLILDDFDYIMLNTGFELEVRRVVQDFSAPDKTQRQTLIFSVTFPEELQKLAAELLNDHIFLTVGVVGGAPSNIQQNVIEVTEGEKREKLQEMLSAAGMIQYVSLIWPLAFPILLYVVL